MRYVLPILFILAFAACAPPSSCDVQSYSSEVNPIIVEWQDAMQLAGKTPRMSLPPQIANLQAIERKAENVQAPECLKEAHALLIQSMNTGIDAFLSFLAQESQTAIDMQFTRAAAMLEEYNQMLADAR